MACKSAIYAVNTTVGTAIVNGGVYAPTTIIRRSGKDVQLGSNGITLDGTGYYDVDVVATVEATAAADVTATLYQDGVAVPGATTTATASAIGSAVSLPISALVRVKCCLGSELTVVISGQATTSYNLSVKVEKE